MSLAAAAAFEDEAVAPRDNPVARALLEIPLGPLLQQAPEGGEPLRRRIESFRLAEGGTPSVAGEIGNEMDCPRETRIGDQLLETEARFSEAVNPEQAGALTGARIVRLTDVESPLHRMAESRIHP